MELQKNQNIKNTKHKTKYISVLVLALIILVAFFVIYSPDETIESKLNSCFINIDDPFYSCSEDEIKPNKSLLDSNQGYEKIEDRHLGYILIKPIGYKEYDFDYKDDVIRMHSPSRRAFHMNIGVSGTEQFKIERIFKDEEESVIDAYKRIVDTDNITLYTTENSETVREMSKYFPENYIVFHAQLKSSDTYEYGSPNRRYLAKNSTRWVIYNPQYPDRYYVFDTSIIREGMDFNYLTNTLNDVPWQASLRIIDGDAEFEYLNKSYRVPEGIYPYRVVPVSEQFTIRGTDYTVYTPGDTKSGYDFAKVLIESEVEEGNEKTNTVLNYVDTITEVKEAIRPDVHDLSNSEDGPSVRTGYSTSLTGKHRRSNQPHLYFISDLDYFWFSEDWQYFVVGKLSTVDSKEFEKNGKINVKVFKYDWQESSYWEAMRSTLDSVSEFKIYLEGGTYPSSMAHLSHTRFRLESIETSGDVVSINIIQQGSGFRIICDLNLEKSISDLNGKDVVVKKISEEFVSGCNFEFDVRG